MKHILRIALLLLTTSSIYSTKKDTKTITFTRNNCHIASIPAYSVLLTSSLRSAIAKAPNNTTIKIELGDYSARGIRLFANSLACLQEIKDRPTKTKEPRENLTTLLENDSRAACTVYNIAKNHNVRMLATHLLPLLPVFLANHEALYNAETIPCEPLETISDDISNDPRYALLFLQPPRTINHKNAIFMSEFPANTNYFAVASYGVYKEPGIIQIFNRETGQLLQEIKRDDLNGAFFSPNGQYLVSTAKKSSILYELTKNGIYQEFLDVETDPYGVIFNKNNTALTLLSSAGQDPYTHDAIASSFNHRIHIINLAKKYSHALNLRHPYAQTVTVGFSDTLNGWHIPYERGILIVQDRTSSIMDTANLRINETPEKIYCSDAHNVVITLDTTTAYQHNALCNTTAKIINHKKPITSSMVHPNGDYLITAGQDNNAHIYNLKTNQLINTITLSDTSIEPDEELSEGMTIHGFSPDGSYAIISAQNAYEIMHAPAEENNEDGSSDSDDYPLCYNQYYDAELYLYNFTTNTSTRISLHEDREDKNEILNVTMTPDNNRVIINWQNSPSCSIIELEENGILQTNFKDYNEIQFSPDNQYIIKENNSDNTKIEIHPKGFLGLTPRQTLTLATVTQLALNNKTSCVSPKSWIMQEINVLPEQLKSTVLQRFSL